MFLVLDSEESKLPHIHPWDTESFLCSIGMETEDNLKRTWLFNHVTEPVDDYSAAIKELQAWIDRSSLLVFHNAKHDIAWLLHVGIKITCPVWCTQVGDYVLFGQNPEVELNLNACCRRRNLPVKKDLMAEFWKQGVETNEIPWDIHKEYLENDVHITRLLFEKQREEVEQAKLTRIVEVNSNIATILADMEYTGIKFDKKRALELREEYLREAEEWRLLLFEYTGFEFLLTSPKQMQAILFGGELKRPVKELVAKRRKNGTYRTYDRRAEIIINYPGLGIIPHTSSYNTASGQYSTGKIARALMECPNEFTSSFRRVLDKWAIVNKAWSTVLNADETSGWVTQLQMDGRIHPTFNNCFTRTGRFSCKEPNVQNLARYGYIKLKESFIPAFDYILSVDLSQIEWRMAAALSEDAIMCKEIINGMDCHTENGEKFFGVKRDHPTFRKTARQVAKVFNFRMIYGGGAKAFLYDPNMPRMSLEKWQEIVKGFKQKYKTLTSWQKNNLKQVEKHKYIRNKTGRIITFHYNADPDKGQVGYKPSDVCNYPVQSSGTADLPYLVMLEMYKFIKDNGYKTKLILQVHDSLVFDTPKEEAYIIAKQCLFVMKNLPELSERYYGWKPCVPTEGEATIGKNYGETLKWKGKALEVKLEDLDTLKEAIEHDFQI